MAKHTIEIPDDVWSVIEAIAKMRKVNTSEALIGLIHSATGYETSGTFISNIESIQGDIIGRDKNINQSRNIEQSTVVGGNVGNIGNKVSVGGEINGNITMKQIFHSPSITINLTDETSQQLITNGKLIELAATQISPKQKQLSKNETKTESDI